MKIIRNNIFRPKIKNSVLIVGLPGFGNVGKIVSNLLIKTLDAKLFTEIYSSSLPDHVLVDENGVCRPPKYEFYVSTDRNLVVLTSETQPPLEDVKGYYDMCDEALNLMGEYDCQFLITIDGFPSTSTSRNIHIAATSSKTIAKYMERGLMIYGGTKIVGSSGLFLGMAKERGLKGICLLGSTSKLSADQETALRIFKFLTKNLDLPLKEEL